MGASGDIFIPASYATLTAFNADNTITNAQVSWVEDVRQIFVGRQIYPGAYSILGTNDSFPAQASAQIGVLYVKPSTMEIRRYTNTGYDVLVRPITSSVTNSHDAIPTAGAVWSSVNNLSSSTTAAINTLSGGIQTKLDGKVNKLVGITSGYVLISDNSGGMQAAGLPLNRVADTSLYGSGFRDVSFNNGQLTYSRFAGGSKMVDIGAALTVSHTFLPEQGILRFFGTSGGVQTHTDANLSSLMDVYTGNNRRRFLDGVGVKLVCKTYYLGMAVATGEVVKNGGNYYLINATGNLTITADGPNLAHTVITPISSELSTVVQGVYYDLDGDIYKITMATTSQRTYKSYMLMPVTNITVADYKITADLNLAPDGHLYNHTSGLAVDYVTSAGNGISKLITAGGVYNYGLTVKRDAISSAVDSAVDSAAALVNAASATLQSGKIDKGPWKTPGYLAITDAAGGVQSSTYQPGGATLAPTPTTATLATEKAVQNVSSAVNSRTNVVSSSLQNGINTMSAGIMTEINDKRTKWK